MKASAAAPGSGTYSYSDITNDYNLSKILYYGYGGPAELQSSGYFDIAGDKTWTWDLKYILTHMTLTAYTSGSVQRTTDVTLNGDSRNSITITLPNGVTCHNVSRA